MVRGDIMAKKRKRGDFPRFSLRDKIRRRKDGKREEDFHWDWEEEERYREPRDPWSRFPLSSLVDMHKFLWEKTLVTVVFLIFVYLLSFFSFPLAVTLREAVYHAAAENLDITRYSGHMEPVFSGIRELYPFGFLEEKVLEEEPSGDPGEKDMQFVLPVEGPVAGKFGLREDPFTGTRQMHYGIDLMGAPREPVVSIEDGQVSAVYEHPLQGHTVEVSHQGQITSYYAGLGEVVIEENTPVNRGETIGFLKEEDNPLLHFQIREMGHPVDPLDYFPGTG